MNPLIAQNLPSAQWQRFYDSMIASKNMPPAAVDRLRTIFLGAQFTAFKALVLNDFNDADSLEQLEAWHRELGVFAAEMKASIQARRGAHGE